MKIFKKVFKGKKVIALIVSVLFMIGLGVGAVSCFGGGGNSNIPPLEEVQEQASTTLPIPDDGSTPADHSPNDNVFIAFTALSKQSSFVSYAEGEAVSLGVTQKIKAARIVNNGEIYKESVSHSSFKSVGTRLYLYDGNYIVHQASDVTSVDEVVWKEKADKVSKESFLSMFGHFYDSITAYVMKEETIISSQFLGQENGVYSYRYNLDPMLATVRIALEMRTMAGTKALPLFESVSLTVRMDKNWQVQQTVTDCAYEVAMLGGVRCVEAVTETFSSYGEKNEIPNAAFYRAYLDADVTEPLPEEPTALDYIMDGFAPYITGEKPLKVALNVSATIEDKPLTLSGVAQIHIDIDDLSALAVTLRVDELSYADIQLSDILLGYKENALYVQYGGIKGYAAIDGLSAELGRVLPIFNVEVPDMSDMFANIDLQTLLNEAVLTQTEGKATVSLSLPVAQMQLNALLHFDENEALTFTGATVDVDGNGVAADVAVTSDDLQEDLRLGDGYNDILPLLQIIDDEGNISLRAETDGLGIDATLNVKTLSLCAVAEGIEIFADLKTGDIYARYAGVKMKMNIDELDGVMTALQPLFDKLSGVKALDGLSLGAFESIRIQDILSSLQTSQDENLLTVCANINGIKAALHLSTEDSALSIDSVDVEWGEIKVALIPTTEIIRLDFDLQDEYISVKDLANEFVPTVCEVFFSDSLSVQFNGALTNGNQTYTVQTGEIQIDGLALAPRANARLVLEIATANTDGTTTKTTHEIRLVYLDPTLVENGKTNVYFTYDDKRDENVLEGTFTTTKATQTLDIVKEIYVKMPQLQEVLKPIIVPDENGMPILPQLDVDFTKLIRAASFANGELSLDLNGQSVLNFLPSQLLVSLIRAENALTVFVPQVQTDGMGLQLQVIMQRPADGVITDETFTYTPSGNESDFSSINELLETLANTAEFRSFDISGNIGMSLGSWDIAKDKIAVRAQLDVIDSQTYAVVTLERSALSILGMSVWKDYDGTSKLFFDPVNQMIYLNIMYRTRKLVWFKYEYTTHYEYYKYTVEEFTADIMTPLLKMIRLSDTLEKMITDEVTKSDTDSSVTSIATVENTLLKYAYNGTDTFTLNLDFEPLLGDIQAVDVNIYHDVDKNVSGLKAQAKVVNILTLNLDAKLNTPYDVYQQTDMLVEAEAQSGNY